MSMLLTSVRSAVRLAPFLVLPLLGTLAAGCGGGSPEVDPTIKVEKGQDVTESVASKKVTRGASKQEAAPKQRVGGGPG